MASGVINFTVDAGDGIITIFLAGSVYDVTIIVGPDNAADVVVTYNGQAAVWFPGMRVKLFSIDMNKLGISGTAGDFVTIVGQTAPVR